MNTQKAFHNQSKQLRWAVLAYLFAMSLVFVGCNNNRGSDGGGAPAGAPQPVTPALVGACQGNFIPALTNVRGTAQSNSGELLLAQVCGDAQRLMQNSLVGGSTLPGAGNIIPFSIYAGPVMAVGSLTLAGNICGLPAGQYQVVSGLANAANPGLIANAGMASMGSISGLALQIIGPAGAINGQLSGLTWSQSGGSIHLSNPGVRINGVLQLGNGCSLSLF